MSTNTVRVRIFVRVSPSGYWVAYGNIHSADVSCEAVCAAELGDLGYWIEADLPVPGAQPTLTATITRA